jgi:hypothetical protein
MPDSQSRITGQKAKKIGCRPNKWAFWFLSLLPERLSQIQNADPIRGADKIARFFVGIMKKGPHSLEVRRVRLNGQPGLVNLIDGQIYLVLTLDVADDRVANCFVVRNPDKLARVAIG